MQASALRAPKPYNATAAVDPAKAFRALIRQRLPLAESAFRCFVQVRARQSSKQTGERHQPACPLRRIHRIQCRQGHAVLDAEAAGSRAPQGREMPYRAECSGNVLCERADIRSLAAADADLHERAVEFEELELRNAHPPGLSRHALAFASKLVQRHATALE